MTQPTLLPELTPCAHPRKGFRRKPFANGGGFHIVELCLVCGENVRGAGTFISFIECPDDPAKLLPIGPPTPADLLTYLRGKGLTPRVEGDKLMVGPTELLTDEIRELIRESKSGLVAALNAEEVGVLPFPGVV